VNEVSPSLTGKQLSVFLPMLKFQNWSVDQVVEHLPNKLEALNPNPSIEKPNH
jgi:hypothetical protein